jgi:hypothetical protein
MAQNPIANYINLSKLEITGTTGTVVDLTNVFMHINIYENIFFNFMSAKVLLSDSNDLQQHLPIIGNEDVKIAFNNDGQSPVILNFKVYKVDKDLSARNNNDKKRVISLYLVSKEAIDNEITKISKKLSGLSHSLVSGLLATNLGSTKTFLSESATSNIDVWGNFSRPFDLIDYICKISKNASYSDYIFYETLSGFNFFNLSYLMNQAASWEIHPVIDTIEQSFSYGTIKSYRFDNYFDIMTGGKVGMFGNTIFKFDNQYQFTKEENTFEDISSDVKYLGNHYYFDTNLKSEKANIKDTYYTPEISSIREIFLRLLNNYSVTMKLNGTTERQIGSIANVEFPNLDNETKTHKMWDGLWLLTEINHNIDITLEYTQNIRMVKNAFFNYDGLTEV